MANTFLNATEYANSFLALLKNQLVLGRLVSMTFNDQVTDENGLSVNVKKPPQFIAKDGATLAAQNIAVGKTSIAVNRYRNVHISVGDLEWVQSYNDLMRSETMKSMASTLAHDVDLYIASLLKYFPSHVGTIGETVKTPAQFFKVHTRLMEQSVPNESLNAVMTFEDAELIRGSLVTGNIQSVNRSALEKIRVPLMSEIDPYATQHIPSLTVGTRVASATAQVDGAAENVDYVSVKDADYATITVKSGGASATIKAGELFTIAGVYAVNNRTGAAGGVGTIYSYLKQFVVMEDLTLSGGGAGELKYFPPIIVAGTGGAEADTNTAFQTVSAVPADSAAITWLGVASTTYLTRAAWHKSAIQLVSARLRAPDGDPSSFAQDPETGIAIRYWRGSNIGTGAHVHRFDMIYGAKVVDPRLGTRYSGAA